MKSIAALLLVVAGLGAGSFGCGSGAGGPRSLAEGGSAGSLGFGGAGGTTTGTAAGGGGGMGATSPNGGSVSTMGGSGMTGTAGAGGAGVSQPCGPAWMAGSNYVAGNIVLFEGAYFIALHDNPGYDPTISTYFWDPYSCATSGGNGGSDGAGGTAPLGNSSFDDLVSEALFNQMFPNKNGFYTYRGLVDATRKYPEFGGSGTPEQRKREIAAFLANVARETGELVYVEQIQKDVYCASSAKCPCEPGKSYYGRGPIQISWNYNYCLAGDALGYDLRAQPELVAQNATIAWATGLWFWMTQKGAGGYTPHDAMVGDHGFGETIRSINGDVECNGGSPDGVNSRASFYQNFCNILGVSPGSNLTC